MESTKLPRLSLQRERVNLAILAIAVAVKPILAMLVQYPLAYLWGIASPGTVGSPLYTWCIGSLPLYLVALPVAYAILRLAADGPKVERTSLTPWRLLTLLGLATALSFLAEQVVALALRIFSFLPDGALDSAVSEMALASPLWMTLLFSVVLAPLFEELFYRRMLLDRLCRYGTLPAVLSGGLLFGLIHGNLTQLIPATAVGMLLSYVYLSTGRLRYAVLLHAAVNLVGGVLPVEIHRATLHGASYVVGLQGIYFGLVGLSFLLMIPAVRWLWLERRILPPVGGMRWREWVSAVLLNPGVLLMLGALTLLFLL